MPENDRNKGKRYFLYMKDTFSAWWSDYDMIIDYILIDYLLMSGYRHVPTIKEVIDRVPNNNENIFEMYKFLNEPYSEELYDKLT